MAHIVLLALAAAVFPLLLACVAIIMARPEPRTMLFAFYIGGLLVSVTAGVLLLSVFSDHRAVLQAVFNYLSQALVMLGIATADGKAPEGQPATLLNVPLFHVTAEVPVFLQSFAMGRKLVLMQKWDAEEAMRLIEAEAISYFVGVPLMSFEILTHPNRAKYNLSTVTDFAAGGAPRPVEHVRRIKEEMGGGAPLLGYGLTETNGVGCGNWRDNYLAKPNSTGGASATFRREPAGPGCFGTFSKGRDRVTCRLHPGGF
jgi:acyl-CoA synthetase (AMP-forming)/AMP-acid ligase II